MISSLYIDLMKKVLTDYHRMKSGEFKPVLGNKNKLRHQPLLAIDSILRKFNYAVCKIVQADEEKRQNGRDWPAYAETMIGMKRLENIEYCINDVLNNNIKGDFIETGVWRGGATIFMKAVLKDRNITDRRVWVADSFEGVPKPDEKYSADKGDKLYKQQSLAISMEEVKSNFEKYGLLDDQVMFLKGWFKDTLPTAPISSIAVLRLDGDLYESTMDGLINLYPKLEKGGYVIVDDYGTLESCAKAVTDYREKFGITEEIKKIDWSGIYWKKESFSRLR